MSADSRIELPHKSLSHSPLHHSQVIHALNHQYGGIEQAALADL